MSLLIRHSTDLAVTNPSTGGHRRLRSHSPGAKLLPMIVRFGPFELDRAAGELRKDGVRLRLQDKPLRVLEALIERPGALITREELRKRLWSDDTFVDFDNSLNNAINRLRAALDDEAGSPRFVETVGRRGYRFLAQASTDSEPAGHVEQQATARPLRTRLVVLPFRILRPDAETDFLASSLPDAIAASLSGLESLLVRSTVAAARFVSEAPDLRAMAEALDVDVVLVGSILRGDNRLRITTQLVEAPGGALVWTHTSEASLEHIFELQDDLARRIVESLSLPLSVRERSAAAARRARQRRGVQAVPARESSERGRRYLGRRARPLPRIDPRRSRLRTGMGAPRPHVSADGEVRRGGCA